jgi:hypothetical protein
VSITIPMSARAGIVVPTLGTRPDWLSEAVVSIEEQGEDVDLVIVAPLEAVALIAAQLPGRRVIGESRKGIVQAIETGWQALPNCELLAWLGDDDQLLPGSLRAAKFALAGVPGASMVYGDYEYLDASGRRLVSVRPGRFAVGWLRLGQNFIAQPGCLYVRDAVRRTGGLSRTLRLAFDVDLHARLARIGRAVYCPLTLARIRTHATSLTTAENASSLKELAQVVWGPKPYNARTRFMSLGRPLWALAGRAHYRSHRRY